MTRNRSREKLIAFAAAAGIAAAASAQSQATYVLTSSNEPVVGNPTTTISVWATWDDPNAEFLFGAGDYDLTTNDGWFASSVNVLNGPGSSAGAISGGSVTGAANGQLHIPSLNFFGSTDNPILLATYVWTTTDFTVRKVSFETSNTINFFVADRPTGATTQLYPHAFTHGVLEIVVFTPSPTTLTALAMGGLIAARRRRFI